MRLSDLMSIVCQSTNHAVGFLAFVGLLAAPSTCPRCGKGWKLFSPAEGLEAYALFSEDARSKSVTCSHLPGKRFFL